MITAKNYAAQAERALIQSLSSYEKLGWYESMVGVMTLVGLINKAVHFVIPDGGNILNNNLKGLQGMNINLPYSTITIEYFVNAEHGVATGLGNIHVAKRLILACDSKEINQILRTEFDGVCVFSCNFVAGLWVPQCVGAVLQREWENQKSYQLVQILPEVFAEALKQGSTLDHMCNDVKPDCGALMELLEALTCQNVSTANHQTAVINTKRLKAGKLPIYETKMLVINSGYLPSCKAGTAGGSHASPRQHLRRGHIRRLESGNIWVNSCVVGDPTKGSINKQYAVV